MKDIWNNTFSWFVSSYICFLPMQTKHHALWFNRNETKTRFGYLLLAKASQKDQKVTGDTLGRYVRGTVC